MDPSAIRLIILAAMFGSVILLAELGVRFFVRNRQQVRAVNERLQLIARGMSREKVLSKLLREKPQQAISLPPPLAGMARKLEKTLAGAGLTISASQLLLMLMLSALVLFALLLVVAYFSGILLNSGKVLLIGTFAVAIGFGLPLIYFGRKADRRRKKLTEQFPIALDVFVRGLRAGHPIAAALELLTQEMTDPIGSEFGLVVDEMTYGADLRDALQNMADRCGVDDMQMFVVSLSVQGETGGNLAEILENLSKVIRERASMMMKVRALSSEGRMTAVMLTVLPVLSFTGLFILNPRFYLDVADDPAFMPGFVGLLLLYGIGFYIIRRMVDLKV
ncbi:MAG TPA: type II secretion system F family protein [Allosphingosinicella sp.]|uniref:type II secretion system F family protein n=1 Tax=Allosphingosinicella sp. TaxID=2823234 RepID=UPI002EDACF05